MFRSLSLSTAFLALATAPAFADLTAAEVWAQWQAFAADSGATLTAQSQAQSGGTLTLTGVTFTMDTPEGSALGEMGDLTLTERGDGSVAIEVPVEYPVRVSGSTEGEGDFAIDLTVSHQELEIVASGSAAATSYAYGAPRLSVTAREMEADGETFPMELDMSLTAFSGSYDVTEGDPMSLESAMTAGGLAFAFAASDPEGQEGEISIVATMSDLETAASGTMTSLPAMASLGDMVAEGMTSESSLSYGNGRYEISGSGDGQAFDLRATVGSGGFDFAVGEDGLSYGGANEDVSLSVQSSELPLPEASMAIERTSWRAGLPVGVTEDARDFGLALTLDGLTISDMIWAMLDPAQALPRDPAFLTLDLAGRGNWLIDFTDPTLGEDAMGQMPGQIETLSLKALRLSLVGAELTGTGDFTFDNSAGPSVPPTPVGQVDLQLVGGNGLIDTLVNMGMLPQEQAMGARMMLGLFARPGDGEDTLVSTIELTPGGGIVANGQPLR